MLARPRKMPRDPVHENHKQDRDKGQPWWSPTRTINEFDLMPIMRTQLLLWLHRDPIVCKSYSCNP